MGRSDVSGPSAFERRAADWLGALEAQARILHGVDPLPAESVPLAAALGRTLATDAVARARMPPWDNAAMDGYAVRAADVGGADDRPVRLQVVGRILAGTGDRPPVGAGQACRIMTGAPLPPGADSVVRVEDTDAEEDSPGTVEIRSARDAGGNVRPGGQDMEAGAVAAPAGTRLTSGWIGVLGAAGWDPVPVRRAPVVAILTGGDELRATDDFADVLAGQAIPDSNGPMLAAAVLEAGGRPLLLGPARDDPADIRSRLSRAADADVVVTVGGASMGEADLLKDTLEADGMQVDFWRVRIRPGSPLALGRLPGAGATRRPLLSLPGNPASAWVTFLLFVRPLVRALSGDPAPHLPVVRARAGERLGSVAHLCHFHRVVLDPPGADGDLPTARMAGHPGSGLVQTLGVADGLAVVPEGVAAWEPGDEVEVVLVAPAPGASSPGFAALRP